MAKAPKQSLLETYGRAFEQYRDAKQAVWVRLRYEDGSHLSHEMLECDPIKLADGTMDYSYRITSNDNFSHAQLRQFARELLRLTDRK